MCCLMWSAMAARFLKVCAATRPSADLPSSEPRIMPAACLIPPRFTAWKSPIQLNSSRLLWRTWCGSTRCEPVICGRSPCAAMAIWACSRKIIRSKSSSPNTLPALSKAGANYMNSQLIRMEAAINGYAEGIALDDAGFVSEGSGENIFVIRDGRILTPPLAASVLPGITRDTIMRIAQQLGFEVVETLIPREMLYIADEIFFSGTAAEVTPIRSVDRIVVGNGRRGPITEQIQKRFFDVVNGRIPDEFRWLTFVSGVPATEPVTA